MKKYSGQTEINVNIRHCFGENHLMNMICRGGYNLYIASNLLKEIDRIVDLDINHFMNNYIFIITSLAEMDMAIKLVDQLESNNLFNVRVAITNQRFNNFVLANTNTVKIGSEDFFDKNVFPAGVSIANDYLYNRYLVEYEKLLNGSTVISERDICQFPIITEKSELDIDTQVDIDNKIEVAKSTWEIKDEDELVALINKYGTNIVVSSGDWYIMISSKDENDIIKGYFGKTIGNFGAVEKVIYKKENAKYKYYFKN